MSSSDIGMSAAAGFFQSVVCFATISMPITWSKECNRIMRFIEHVRILNGEGGLLARNSHVLSMDIVVFNVLGYILLSL